MGELKLPKGSAFACNLLHSEDDYIYLNKGGGGGSARYDLVMATDAWNDCRHTGKDSPCIKIYNNGDANNPLEKWQAFKIRCVGNTVVAPGVKSSTNVITFQRSLDNFVALTRFQLEQTPQTTMYPLWRDGGKTINFRGAKVSVNSNTCSSNKFLCSFKPDASKCKGVSSACRAHLEMKLPKGASFACNLLHWEDDAVYVNGKKDARYDLIMATDGGNDCHNTGSDSPCVKIFNDGVNGDAMRTWQGFVVRCEA